MYIKNENNQLMSVADYAEEILTEGFGLEQVTEEDAQNALSELYAAGYNDEIVSIFDPGFSGLKSLESTAFDKVKLWDKLKKAVCDFINGAGSTVWGEILEKLLEIISNIIPGGKLIKKLVKAIVKYIIDLGLGKLCSAT